MLTQYQNNRLENIQKTCLRSIYGYNKPYEELLQEADLDTLDKRRENALRKFAAKSLTNKQFEHWFPLNQNRASQRQSKMYQEKFAKGDRLYNSPLFEMRRILNESEKEARREATEAIDLSDLFNQP